MKLENVKVCNVCSVSKSTNDFHKGPGAFGVNASCKPCVCARNKARSRSYKGLMMCMNSNSHQNSRDRGHVPPSFTKSELFTFIEDNGYKRLFDAWVASDYEKLLKPSIDRLDSTKPYSIGNIRLVTWDENNIAAYTERKSCKRITRQNRKIRQLTEDFEPVMEYGSISKAARDNGFCRTNINGCLQGLRELAHGFRWEYIA